MRYTTNLQLKKPDILDNVKLQDLHDNLDTVDAEIAKKANAADIPSKLSQFTKDVNFDERYYTESEIDGKLGSKANSSHSHTISDVTNLQTTLDGKASSSHSHNVATTSSNGLMSSSDKTKLDGIENGANKYILETHDRSKHSDINQSLLTTDTVQFKRIGVGTATPNEDVDVVGNVRVREQSSVKFGGVGASDSAFEIKYNEETKSLDFNFLL